MVQSSLVLSLKQTVALVKAHDEAIARWVSHIVSPHIVGIVLTAILALSYSDTPLNVLLWLALLVPLVVIPPLLYVLWLVRAGTLEDIYMPRRETRIRPLTVSMVWLLVCLWMIRAWAAPPMVEAIVMVTLILTGVLSLVTLFWKISFHGASISAAAIATVMMGGTYALPVMLLVLLVGWARIRLQRHTPRQVIYGSLLGGLIGLLLVNGALLREL